MTANDIALLNRSRAQSRAHAAAEHRRRMAFGAAMSILSLMAIILTLLWVVP